MSKIILNSKVLHELISSNTLQLVEKHQKQSGKNYFFMPTISLQLYKAKVSWIDAYKKNISFVYNKYENQTLYTLLKNINMDLITFYKDKYNNKKSSSMFFYEKDEYFYIKCYLPNIKYKYFINSFFNDIKEPTFKMPYVGTIYSTVIIDIKNIWEQENNYGFNLELKETYINV